jgi:hypothetical protein
MLKSRHLPPIFLALLLAGFGLGVVRLFQLRFSAGDIYPPYSSLRADPLGARAFYESLRELPGLAPRRFYQDSSKLQGGPNRALFLFGTDPEALGEMPGSDYTVLRGFLFSGGRIVISLLPDEGLETASEPGGSLTNSPAKTRSKSKPPPRDDSQAEEASEKIVSFFDTNRLRLEKMGFFIANADANRARLAETSNAPAGLPAAISWHSAAYFSGMDTNWRTVYQFRDHPVVIERSFGSGSLVLSTDSYFVSNEALRNERHASLLAWLVGDRREVLFDETHLGVEENPGMSALWRQYHLQGVLLGLLLVAGLFVWKNSVSLVPPPPDEPVPGRGDWVAGRESMAGFASLLRRSIPPSEIFDVCVAEWKAACARNPRVAARLPAVERIIAGERSRPPRARQPVQSWQAIQRVLTER